MCQSLGVDWREGGRRGKGSGREEGGREGGKGGREEGGKEKGEGEEGMGKKHTGRVIAHFSSNQKNYHLKIPAPLWILVRRSFSQYLKKRWCNNDVISVTWWWHNACETSGRWRSSPVLLPEESQEDEPGLTHKPLTEWSEVTAGSLQAAADTPVYEEKGEGQLIVFHSRMSLNVQGWTYSHCVQ